MRLIILAIGVVATIAAALAAIVIALTSTERGRAATATVAQRVDPQVTQLRQAIEPGVETATKALRRIPVVSDRLPAAIPVDGSTPAEQIAGAADTAAAAAGDAIEAAGDAIEAAGDAIDDAVGAAGDAVKTSAG